MIQDQPKPEEKEELSDKLTLEERQQIAQVQKLAQDAMQRTGRTVITVGELINDPEEIAIERSRERRQAERDWEAERRQDRLYGYDDYSFSRKRYW